MKLSQNRNVIAPSLLSADFSQLAAQMKEAEDAGCNWFHCDIMDGHFVPNITFGPFIVKSIRKNTSGIVDTHLMILNPDNYIRDFAEAGADVITVHQETCPHLHRTIQLIKSTGASAGVSINPSTPVELLSEILEEIDLLLIMSVNPGFGGQSFIPNSIKKIEKAANFREQKGLDFVIQVDGGVNEKTIASIKNAGCDVFVAGSAFFNSSGVNESANKLINAIK